jgi:hypothetical protein
VSVEAISWALNLASVPADHGGQPSSACKFVLVGLANQAGPDGSCALPAVRTLMRYTGLSEGTVRACRGRLEAAPTHVTPPGMSSTGLDHCSTFCAGARSPSGWRANTVRSCV